MKKSRRDWEHMRRVHKEVLTMNILHYIDTKTVTRYGNQDFSGTLPPRQVIGRAPRGYCTE
jgi:hypothetical protein